MRMNTMTSSPVRTPLIRLENATVVRGGNTLIANIDWTLHRGEHWAVYGRNGAGKSTFLRVVRGEMPPASDGRREYCFDGEPSASPLGLRRRIGLVSPELQAVYARQSWNITGREVVLAGFFDTPLLYETPSGAQRQEAEAVLDALGATWLAEVPVRRMSTGQLRTMLFARALAVRPDVLVLDECLDGLDVASREAMLTVIEKAAAMTTLVCAAHRPEHVPGVVDNCLLLRQGRLVCGGKRKELREQVTAELFGDEVSDRAGGELGEVTGAASTQGTGQGTTQGTGPDLPYLPNLLNFPGSQGGHEAPVPLVRLTKASVYLEGRPVLQDIDWEIRSGENWIVLGENGAGKTTLLRVLCGDLPVHLGGEVVWFGRDGSQNVAEVRRRVGVVSDHLQSGYEYDLSVGDLVLSGFFGSDGLYEQADEAQREIAERLIARMGLAELKDRRIRSLSYGQQRKAFIARALVPGNRLLLLDEPLSGLDPAGREEILSLVRGLTRTGLGVVYITHYREELPDEFDRLLTLDKGRVTFQGLRSS